MPLSHTVGCRLRAAPSRVNRPVARAASTASAAVADVQFPKHFTYTPGKAWSSVASRSRRSSTLILQEPVKGTPAIVDPKTGREPLVVAIG